MRLLLSSATLLSAIGSIVPAVWFLAPLGLGVFFYVLLYGISTWRGAFFSGLLFGALTSGAGMIWFFEATPLAWMGVTNPFMQFYLAGALWSIASLAAGFATACFALALYCARNTGVAPLLAIPLFVVEEELRMWLFSFVTWAPESLVGPHFSSILLGYTLAENNFLLQLSAFGGVRMLGASIALIACISTLLLRYCVHKDSKAKPQLVVACVVFALVLSLPVVFPYRAEATSESLTIALVSTDVPIASVDAPDLLGLFKRIHAEGYEPDLIALPEGHGLEEQIPDQKERTGTLQEIFSGQEVLIVGSNYSAEQGKKGKAQLTYESTQSGILARYQKIFLMPEGEYSPVITKFFLRLAGSAQVNQYLNRVERPVAKGKDLVTVPYAGVVFGGLLCSDALSPELVADLTKRQGAQVVFALSNNAWFHHSHTLYTKLLQIAKTNAVTHRVYYLAASNDTPSFAIAPDGHLVAESLWNKEGVIYIDIPVAR